MTSSRKPIILTFIGNYLPGYKSGGIQRVTINTVDHLCDEFEFRIVTRDRDLGDDKPYPNIQYDQWQTVGNAKVYYLPPQAVTVSELFKLVSKTPHDVLFLNSFFEPLTVKALFNRKVRRGFSFKPAIVSPWGEFAWASLSQKYPKKYVFIKLARLFGLYDDVTWRASSKIEEAEIIKEMNTKPETIHITGDFPIKNVPAVPPDAQLKPPPGDQGLKIIFLSRISREKNLDYALKVLRRLKTNVVFDIYGPAENVPYWNECRKLIEQLPTNVRVNYFGRVEANLVVHIFSHYNLFLFPTGGEAYGHVIAECLTAGTPVLLSTDTPWRNLEENGFGWDFDLSQMDSFVDTIERHATLTREERSKIRADIKSKIGDFLLDPGVVASNRELFLKQLGKSQN
ncbi:MAG: hypothetical protein [Olavius algarvensis Delta 4 endosymbiont]|nr:MAG: hypothetical protein [Olavius algarvensis Delta 4 endosymbiont]